ncbi:MULTISPECIES: YciI family protein [Acinetobacter]|uniref:YciI family protein n=1 Tax=Acinetobacter TaxID=469 RepID=UPI00157AABFD|nr:YciI family protein [Acinetobacter sp. Marseille-Q1623]
MYIIQLQYQKPLEEVDVYLRDHVKWLKQQFKCGHFIAAGRQDPVTGGVLFAKNMPLAELEEILKLDPFQAVAQYDITKLDVGLTHADFENLKGI